MEKRNAQLADALGLNSAKGITGSGSAGYASLVNTVSYTDELTRLARVYTKFLNTVEQTLAEFVSSQKKSQVLPQMPPDRRKFVHDVRCLFPLRLPHANNESSAQLTAYYRIDTQMVDQEPHRSVQLIRRIDTRLPSPLLSAVIRQPSTSLGLGKSGNLRSMRSSLTTTGSSSLSSGPVTKPSLGPRISALNPNENTSSPSAVVPRLTGLGSVSRFQSADVPARPGFALVEQNRMMVEASALDEPVPENWEDDV